MRTVQRDKNQNCRECRLLKKNKSRKAENEGKIREGGGGATDEPLCDACTGAAYCCA